MRWFLWLTMLAACDAGVKENPKTPTVAPATNTAPPAAAVDGFAGWHRIAPSEERLRCANYADDEYEVFIDAGGVVRARIQTNHEPDTGPALPFTLPKIAEIRGRRSVLAVSDGFLVGHDAGEWGGSLAWFSTDGKRHKVLAKENVTGMVALAPDSVAVLEGLAHLSLNDGRVRWLVHDPKGWRESSVDALDGASQAFAQSGKSIYVATTKGLTRVDGPTQVHVIHPLRTSMLYPDSMVIDEKGQLYMGMRQLVVRFVPKGDKFDEEWLAPPNCRDVERRDRDCICK